MPLHVIGAGLGRTGTLSLKLALEQLAVALEVDPGWLAFGER